MPAYLHASISLDHADDLIPSAESQMSGQSELLVRCCRRTKVLGSDQAGRVRRHSPKTSLGDQRFEQPTGCCGGALQDRRPETEREDFPSPSGSRSLYHLGWVSFTSASRVLPGSAGTPMAVQGPGSAAGQAGEHSQFLCTLQAPCPSHPFASVGSREEKQEAHFQETNTNISALQL